MPARRKPTHLHAIEGTFRRDRHDGRDRRPGPALGRLPPPPGDLSEVAKQEWRGLGKHLVEAGMLAELDLPTLRLCVECIATARKAERVLDEEGLIVEGSNGARKAHPAAVVMNAARSQARALLFDLGCGPRARNSASALPTSVAADDPAEAFFR